jgi:signal transduction histidine kinase
MFKSFRVRLAIISALVSGFALVGFGTFTWWVVHDIKTREVDANVLTHAEREVNRRVPPEAWKHFGEEVLPQTLGVHDPQQVLLLVVDEANNVVYRSEHWPDSVDTALLVWPSLPMSRFDRMDGPPGGPPGMPPGEPSSRRAQSSISTFSANGATWRMALAATPRSRVAVAINLDVIDTDMTTIRNGFLLALPLTLAFIGIGAWFVSGSALRPIQRLGASIRHIDAQRLDQRIAEGVEDVEFDELIIGFNSMLERLEKSFYQASRFSADAAHELKTPLTILQGQIESAMTQVQEGSPIQSKLALILDEVGRLSAISRKLLLLSQADAGRLRLQHVPFNLSEALNELLEDTRMLSPTLAVTGAIPPGLFINADDALLRQVFINLISNAIKYNIAGGWIHIAAAISAKQATIIFSNSSNGIPPEARDKIFERFYRVDSAHNRTVEGSGLGLSLSREIVRAHGGTLTLAMSRENEVKMVIGLPIS